MCKNKRFDKTKEIIPLIIHSFSCWFSFTYRSGKDDGSSSRKHRVLDPNVSKSLWTKRQLSAAVFIKSSSWILWHLLQGYQEKTKDMGWWWRSRKDHHGSFAVNLVSKRTRFFILITIFNNILSTTLCWQGCLRDLARCHQHQNLGG